MTAYRLEFTHDPRAFLDAAGEHLAADPVLGTVIATVAHRALRADPTGTARPGHPQWWVVVRDESEVVVGAAMRTSPSAPHPLWVMPMPEDVAQLLGQTLAERGEAGAGANGALPAARLVAEEAAHRASGRFEAGRSSRLWVLGDLVRRADPPGQARLATLDELELVVAWFADFHPAAERQAGHAPGTQLNHADAGDVERRVEQGLVWLWTDTDDQPVHLTAYSPPSFGVARIGPVYTPDAHRGRGYAGATVGLVSWLLRNEGARVCLFTDAANPISTRVYARLGFEPVVDTADHRVVLG